MMSFLTALPFQCQKENMSYRMYSTRNRGGWGGVSNGMFLMMRCCEEKNIGPDVFDVVLKKLKNLAPNAY